MLSESFAISRPEGVDDAVDVSFAWRASSIWAVCGKGEVTS